MALREARLLTPIVLFVACSATPPTASNQDDASRLADGTVASGDKLPASFDKKAPADLVLVARAHDVSRSIDTADKLVKLPMTLRSLVEDEMKQEKVDFIQLNASFDVAVVLDPASEDEPEFKWALSVPLTNVDRAAEGIRASGNDVRPSSRGMYRAKGREFVCDLGPSTGDSPARAVCAEDASTLGLFTGYMLQGLPAEPKSAGPSGPVDLWARASFAPFKERFLPKLRGEADEGVAELRQMIERNLNVNDPELLDLPAALVKQGFAFAEDLDAMEMTFAVDNAKPEIRISTSVGFRSRTSWLADVIGEVNEKPELPPETFFRLPKDATFATWGQGASPQKFTTMRRIAGKLASAGMAQIPQIRDRERQEVLKWIETIPTATGVWVSASGEGGDRGKKLENLTPQGSVERAKSLWKSYVPWGLSGGPGSGAATAAWLKQTEVLLARSIEAVKREFPKDELAKITFLPKTKYQDNPAGFPAGSALLSVEIPFTSRDVWSMLPEHSWDFTVDPPKQPKEHPAGAAARGSVFVHAAVIPDDGGRYWFAYASDLEVLKAKTKTALSKTIGATAIGSRTDLGLLRTHKGYGGFMSFGSALGNLSESLSGEELKDYEAIMKRLPNKAQAPIFFLSNGNGGGAPTLRFELVLPKSWVEDVASAVQYGVDKELKERRGGGGAALPDPSSPAIAAVASPASSSKPVGIAECDGYLVELEICIKKQNDPAATESLKQSLVTTRDAWRQAAAMQGTTELLRTSCKAASDAMKKACP